MQAGVDVVTCERRDLPIEGRARRSESVGTRAMWQGGPVAPWMQACVLTGQVRVDLLAAGVQPALWSAEAPNLYVLVLTLLGRDGAHIESESCQARCCCEPTSKGPPFHVGCVCFDT